MNKSKNSLKRLTKNTNDVIEIPQYSYSELEIISQEILVEYFPQPLTPPLAIEDIAELKIFDDYILLPNLKTNYDSYGFIGKSGTKWYLHVDEYTADNWYTTCRFTVAEEVAHFRLHKNIFENVHDVSSYISLRDSLSNRLYNIIEKDAKYVAAAILIPTELILYDAWNIYVEKIKDQSFSSEEMLWGTLCKELAWRYEVYEMVMMYRLQNRSVMSIKYKILNDYNNYTEN